MKDELRKKYKNIRTNIKNNNKDTIIYNKVINNEKIKNAKILLCYVSFNDEVDTIKIIKYFINNKIVAVPKIENNEMNFYIIENINELKKGYFDILEPINNKKLINFENAVSITPGICFDMKGFRIGYGKGFYDKFYSKHANIYKIGLTYKECIIQNLPNDSFDIKMDLIISD